MHEFKVEVWQRQALALLLGSFLAAQVLSPRGWK